MKTRLGNIWKENLKKDVIVARLMIIVMLIYIVLPLMPEYIFAQETGQSKIEVIVDDMSVLTGEVFNYTIKYAYSSTTAKFTPDPIVAILPYPLTITDFGLSSHVASSSKTIDADNNAVITFVINEVVGATGVLTIQAKCPIGSISENTKALIDVTGGDNDETRVDPTVNILLNNKDIHNWNVEKSVASPYNGSIKPIPGSDITYNIKVKGNSGNGAYNLQNVVITDTLPSEATYIESSDSGDYNSEDHTVSWTDVDIKAGTNFDATIKVNYAVTSASAISVDLPYTVINNVDATATSVTVSSIEKELTLTYSDSHSLIFDEPKPGIRTIEKKARGEVADTESTAAEYSKDETIKYEITNIGNNGNVPLDTMTVYDILPDGIDLVSIAATGATFYYSTVDMEAESINGDYKKINGWTQFSEIDPISTTASALKVEFGAIAIGKLHPTITIEAEYEESFINAAYNGNVLTEIKTLENVVYVDGYADNYDNKGGVYNTFIDVKDINGYIKDKGFIKLVDPLPIISLSKSSNKTSVYEEETVTYTLKIVNANTATGSLETGDTITIVDTLPNNGSLFVYEDFTILANDANDAKYGTEHLSSTIYTSAEGNQTIKFEISGVEIKSGGSYEIKYSVKVKDNTIVGYYPNTAVAMIDDIDETNKLGPKTDDTKLTATKTVFVRFKGSIDSVKGIGYSIFTNAEHSELLIKDKDGNQLVEDSDGKILTVSTSDTVGDFRFVNGTIVDANVEGKNNEFALPINIPIVNATLPGGIVRYRLEVSNSEANGPISNVVLIDKLPKVGDTGVIVDELRNSAWSPYLIRGISVNGKLPTDADPTAYNAEGVTVFYSTSATPSLSQLSNSLISNSITSYPTDDHDKWTKILPENISDVTYIKIQIDKVLQPNAPALVLEWDMRAPYDAPTEITNEITVDNVVTTTTSAAIAWNSFAYGATYTAENGQEPFLPSEPIKVGTRIESSSLSDLQGSIGNFIWFDEDKDGIQDENNNEIGINDIPIRLYYNATDSNWDTAKILIDETVSGPNNNSEPGYYYFPNLSSGFYKVEFDMPTGFEVTDKLAGDDRTMDSNFSLDEDSGKYISEAINLVLNTSRDITIDAGLYRKTSVGNFVWDDYNGNGIQDDNEPSMVNVTINLYKSDSDRTNDVIFDSTYSDANGYYEFKDLDPDNYYIGVELDSTKNAELVNYGISPIHQTSESIDDSDANQTTGETDTFTLVSTIEKDTDGDYIDEAIGYLTNETIDFGIHKAILGDYVWNDLDRDGIQDLGEPAIAGISVTLVDDVTGNAIEGADSVTTDSTGHYVFEKLNIGTYRVLFTLPKTSIYRPTKAGTDLAGDPSAENDSDGDLTTITSTETNYIYSTNTINLIAGEKDITNDMGFYQPGKIGNFVWEDMNGNGIQDTYNDGTGTKTEPGINGFTVTLYNGSDNIISYTDHLAPYKDLINPITTASNGYYLFDDLFLGNYKVKVNLLEGINGYDGFITADMSSNDSIDSDVDNIEEVSGITSGYTDQTIISSSKYEDLTLDAGVYKYGSLGDTIWFDTNMNGLQDETDLNGNLSISGVQGVTVKLYKGSSTSGESFKEIVTLADGKYLFNDLIPGIYTIKFEDFDFINNKHYTVSPINQGSNDLTDSDGITNTIQDTSATITGFQLLSGYNDMKYDLGIYESYALGNFVWDDDNGNGVQDNGEPGLEGVNLELYKKNSNNTSIKVGNTITTDSNGAYKFEDLPLGTYFVKVVDSGSINIDEDYEISLKDQLVDDKDNDADADTNITGDYIFKSSSSHYNDTVDIGIYKYSELGDYVWEDDLRDGVQEISKGINGVAVNLYKDGGTSAYKTTTTKILSSVAGSYLFTKLPPGEYKVVFEIPVNYTATLADAADASDTTDSDGYTDASLLSYPSSDKINTVENIIITSGTNNKTIDLGLYKSFSIGDFVWLDDNGNGIKDFGELPVSGVTLKLYQFNGDNQTIADDYLVRTLDSSQVLTDHLTTLTDGKYLFSNLPMGKYFVVLEKVGYKMTLQGKGENRTLDSNFEYEPIILNGQTFITSATDPYVFDKATSVTNISNITVDAGLFEIAGLGDKVWLDKNYNGIQDADEPGIANIPVRLYKNSVEIQPNGADYKTNANGEYFFEKLDPGEYSIEFDMPENYYLTLMNQIPTASGLVQDQVDSDGVLKVTNGSTVVINDISLTSNEHNESYDVGLFQKATLGDFVWFDENRDGIQNENGPTISNDIRKRIQVKLYKTDSSIVSAEYFTNEFGYYLFEGLYPGSYRIEFILPNGETKYSVTTSNVESNTHDTTDSDAIAEKNLDTKGIVSNIILVSGDNNLDVDMGFYESFSLGDTIWEDKNMDGIQNDGTDTGIANVKVYLFESGVDGSVVTNAITSVFTDESGNYRFTDIPLGSYFIRIDKPTDYFFTEQDSGTDDEAEGLDSDLGLIEGTDYGYSDAIVFKSNSELYNPTIDVGLYKTSSIGDTVWEDTNRDGIQNEGAGSGIQGVKVYLYEKGADPELENSEMSIKTTDADGKYRFDNLKPGKYFVVFRDLPDEYTVTLVGATTDFSDSDGSPNGILDDEATINYIVIESNETDISYDLGLYKSFSLGDYAWFDTDGDGSQINGNLPVEGLSLKLYKIGDGLQQDPNVDTFVDQTVTDEKGFYEFTDLPMGNYYVRLASSSLYYMTLMNEGADEELDSDFNQLTGISDIHIFNSGTSTEEEYYSNIDIGVFTLAGLGDYVWVDANYNGLQDGNEVGLENVKVRLFKSGTEIRSTFTNNQGYYAFTDIDPGSYSIVFDLPENYFITKPNQGQNDTLDSDASLVNDNQFQAEITGIELDADELLTTFDLGLFKYASISNLVFEDVIRDGIQDAKEPGIPNVTVTLYNKSTNIMIDSVVTDRNGHYLFDQLVPDEYKIIFTNFEKGYSVTASNVVNDALDSDGITTELLETDAIVESIIVVSGEDNEDVDLGLYKNFSIGDKVWYDKDGDGYQDVDEVGVEGITLYLYTQVTETEASVLVKTTTSNGEGLYLFDDLPMGSYFITADIEGSYVVTLQNQISDITDSDFDKNEHKTGNYQFLVSTPEDERFNSSADLGLFTISGLGNRVWLDKNYNGIQDSDEVGVEAALIELKRNNSIVATTKTDDVGYYFFADIDPGVYTIEMTMPSDYYLTHQNKGTDDEKDSDAQLKTGDKSKVVILDYQLYMNESITSLDIGLYQLGSIGDYVWYDTNKDGLQGETELPVTSKMRVELSGESVTKTTEVDEFGKYIFEDLNPGTYTVRFVRINNYRMSPANEGTNDDIDSDANSGGIVENVVLNSGEKIVIVDAGIYYSPASVSTPSPTPIPEVTPIPTPILTVIPTPETTVAPTPTPDAQGPPTITEIKTKEPTIDIPEEEKPKERIFIIDEEVDEVTVVKEPDHGTVIVDDGKNIIYTPDETFDGRDLIVVLIEDGDDEFIMEIDIFEEDIAEAQLAELPATAGMPSQIYYLLGSIIAMTGVVFKKKY